MNKQEWVAKMRDDELVIVGGNAKPSGGQWPGVYYSLNCIEIDDCCEGQNGESMKFARKVAAAMNAAKIKPIVKG